MKVLMLGWEYPPHISGGLGTACHGLTRALSSLAEVEITFIVPQLFGEETAPHMKLTDPMNYMPSETGSSAEAGKGQDERVKSKLSSFSIPVFLKPYLNEVSYLTSLNTQRQKTLILSSGGLAVNRYSEDLFGEVMRYSELVSACVGKDEFDLIHAHDWMTFPAAIKLREETGTPLVVHIHSVEYDRSGSNGNGYIREIERRAIQNADAVIAVSHYTRDVIREQYDLDPENIAVVHNGVYTNRTVARHKTTFKGSKIVLFLGRVTFQKGPDYFVEAAARVVPVIPDALFVLAGDGDMLNQVKHRVTELGLNDNFLFPGFLRGAEVERMLSVADIYVMPSVSEPFGISALEALSFDTPVIISRQSGVSEVVKHALKVDFWDIDKMADLIINGLLYEELRADMVSMAREEVKRLCWEVSAQKVMEVYQGIL